MSALCSGLRFGVLGCAVVVAVAGCSSGGGPRHGGSSSSSPPSSTSAPVASSSSSTSSVGWTPPAYGPAKPAVDAYLESQTLLSAALRDPAHTPASTFDRHFAGEAKQQVDASLVAEKSQGKAYRGKTVRRVRVVANHMSASPKWVVLRDCATVDPADPLVEYFVGTGKPVPTKPHNPPGPYADTIRIFLINGQWTITQFRVDSTRTCTP